MRVSALPRPSSCSTSRLSPPLLPTCFLCSFPTSSFPHAPCPSLPSWDRSHSVGGVCVCVRARACVCVPRMVVRRSREG